MAKLRQCAIYGKGGIGKTTLAALLIHTLIERGVPARKASVVMNLADALGP